MNETLVAAERLAQQGDRVAFFAALIVIGIIGVLGARYFVGQTQSLVNALAVSHSNYQAKLERIVDDQSKVISENTKATVQNTETLRSHSDAFRVVSRHLERLERSQDGRLA